MGCEYAYYLRYVRRVKTIESSASVYGTALHKAIKVGYDNDLEKDEWVKTFKNEWVIITNSKEGIIYSGDKDYIQKLRAGQDIIANYYDKFVKDKPKPLETEYFFSKKKGIKLGKHIVVGVFDQIDTEGRVIDYKSGVKPTKFQMDLDLQFTIYSYAYRKLFGAEEKELVLLHLPTCSEIVTNRTDDEFKVLESEVDKIEKSIEKDFFVRNLDRGCATCYFLEECLSKKKPPYKKWG